MKVAKITKRKRIKLKMRKRFLVNIENKKLRLCVFRSNREIYAQLCDDVEGKVLFSETSLVKDKKKKQKGTKTEIAKQIGVEIGKKAVEKGITEVYFDRNGYLYHGRIAALADGAREGGLKF